MKNRSLWLVTVVFLSCAHGEGATKTAPAPAPETSSVAPAPATQPAGAVADLDGDGVPNDEDACPIEPGLAESRGCAKEWAYFFLRVVDGNRLPVTAELAFQPAVKRVVPREDGYSGKLRPGVYRVEASAPGFGRTMLRFEVGKDEKAFLELVLENGEAEQ